MLGTITKGEYKFEPLPDNVYLAKLTGVKEKAPPKTHPDWFPQLSWTFQVLTDPHKGKKAWGRTPTSWTQGKKLDNWLVTLGINVSTGTSLKIEDLKDLYCKILVKNDRSKDPQTGEEKLFPKVTELLPLDSLDQIKVRELVAGTTVTASAPVQNTPAPVPAYVPATPIFVQPNVQAGGYVPVTTSAPSVPLVANPPIPNPLGNGNVTVNNTPSAPTRTIPF